MPREPMATPSANLSLLTRGRFSGRVLRNEGICQEHYCLTLAVQDFPPSVPGQFVQLSCTPGDDFSDRGADAPVGIAGGVAGRPFRPADEEGSPQELEWHVGGGAALHNDPDLAAARAFLRRPFSIAARRDVMPPPPHAAKVVKAKEGRGQETELDII
ncbi:MAG: hypothetical protein WCI73_13160, partial [Phycisphaerae bacterium]